MDTPDLPTLFFAIALALQIAWRQIFMARTFGCGALLSRFDWMERSLLLLMIPGYFLLPYLFIVTGGITFADYTLPASIQAAGMVFLGTGFYLFWRSHRDLDRNWSISLMVRDNHELVTSGVYQRIRHPMYAAFWLWAIGQGLTLPNWLAGWSLLPAFALLYFLRTPREEALMREKFGMDYVRYTERTGRLLPRLRPIAKPPVEAAP